MDALERQWLILKILPTRGTITTIDILYKLQNDYVITVADNDGAALRSIQRDLVKLESLFPICCDEENPAGWSWHKDAPAFAIHNLDPLAALTFKLTGEYLNRLFPRGSLQTLELYFKAADERLQRMPELQLSQWSKKIKVVSRNLPTIDIPIAEDILNEVYTAVLKGHRFIATYRTASGKTKEYDVNPLGMAFVEKLIYLVATLNEHENPVLLLLHRILDVKCTGIPVTIPDEFDLDKYISREMSFPIEDDIQLKVFFNKKLDIERLQDAKISEDQQIMETEGGWQLNATVSDSLQLRWWLRGYGDRCKVIEPVELYEEFKQLANNMANLYS